MKKISLITAIFCSIFLIAGASFAATGTLEGADASITSTDTNYADLDNIDISPNVTVGYNITDTAYALNSNNSSGTIEYGVAHDSSSIYFKDASGTYTFAAPTSTGAAAFSSGYAVLGGS